MMIRRLTVGIGAALLVGGWGVMQYAKQHSIVFGTPGFLYWTVEGNWGPPGRVIYGGGVFGMAIGAGLIGFAVLRPTNRNDE